MTFEPEHASSIAIYLTVMTVMIGAAAAAFQRFKSRAFVYLLGLIAYGLAIIVLAVKLAPEAFEIVNLMAYGVFVGGPLILMLAAFIARNGGLKVTSNFYYGLALLVVAIAIDAFFIEPHWLETTRYVVRSEKIAKPLKIAVLSDIQTDDVGDYELEVLKGAMAEKPDLILMPGDYIQCLTGDKQTVQVQKFRRVFAESGLKAPLGNFAVRGNVDPDGWPHIFQGFPVTAADQTFTFDIGPVAVTALSFDDSFNPQVKVRPEEKFHIVFGHGPDFALAKPPADLLVAGHCHGGQVRLPGLGPLLTLSRIPRKWADTKTELPTGTLIVSRGIGMERRYAPRLRFLCRPEVVFITLEPATRAVNK